MMKNETVFANEILSKINENENCFIINDDIELTGTANAVIASTPWEAIARNYKPGEDPAACEDENVSLETYDFYSQLISGLKVNKDITQKVQKGSRFYFIKRVLNKIFKLTNRYQQSFNNDSTVLFETISQKLRENDFKDYLLAKELHERAAEIERRLEQVVKTAEVNQTTFISLIQNQIEKTNNIDLRLTEIEQKLKHIDGRGEIN